MYDKLVAKVNSIYTSGIVLKSKNDTDKTELENKIISAQSLHSEFVLKANYIIDKSKLEKKIPDTSMLVIKTDYNAKITEIENKIPNISSLVKITDHDIKITVIEKKLTDSNYDKYITTLEFNKLTAETFAARLKQANVVTKTDFDDKRKSLNHKINSNKPKHLLVENELEKLQTFDSIYFRGKIHFEEDVTQNYLVFQPMYRYFKRVSGVGTGNYIYFWKSKGSSDENITTPTKSDYSLNPQLSYLGNKTRAEFKGSCLYIKLHILMKK